MLSYCCQTPEPVRAFSSVGACVGGVKYQIADNTEIFRATTASGGDLWEYFVDEE